MTGASVAVAGMVAGDPRQGGATWAVLQYVLGLERLGHRVLLVESVAPSSLQPAGASLADTTSGRYFADVVAEFGLAGRAALVRAGSTETLGLPHAQLVAELRRCDLLIDIAGNLRDERELFEPVPRRLYLDLDPGFTQLWQAEGIDMRWDGHTHFATVGPLLAGRHPADSRVPTGGPDWIPTLPPVVLDAWAPAEGIETHAFTTVANWRSYGSVERAGVFYGQKVHSWRALMDLPRLTGAAFMPALSIHPDESADIARLAEGGWQVLDADETVATPAAYRAFVRGSRAEIAIAKSGYVLSRCGWFSERSACYLASGRPVLAQDTGIGEVLPVGEGLLTFSSLEEAVEGVREIERDYARHASAARALAEAHLDARLVLPRLLARAGIT
jgi:hypothetical protein